MMLLWFTAVVALALAQEHGHSGDPHGHNEETLHANQHAVENQLRHTMRLFDTDGDGSTSIDEYMTAFAAADLNGDGNVTLDEYIEVSKAQQHGPLHLIDEQYEFLFEMEETRMGTVPADGVIDEADARYFIQLMDADGDGLVTIAEFEAGWQQDMNTFIQNLYLAGIAAMSTTDASP